jgi:hypothetical protein
MPRGYEHHYPTPYERRPKPVTSDEWQQAAQYWQRRYRALAQAKTKAPSRAPAARRADLAQTLRRETSYDDAQAIARLCSRLGIPEKTGEFVIAGKSLDDVRRLLGASLETSTSALPSIKAGIASLSPAKVEAAWDRAFEQARNRVA